MTSLELRRPLVTLPVRIGLSGVVGSGKTTLAAAIAKEFDIPLIAEDWAGIHDAMLRYERGVAERLDSEARGRRLGDWMKAVHDWCRAREDQYERLPSFVADRWELDAFAHWLNTFSRYLPAAEHTLEMRDFFSRAAPRFHLVVVLPMPSHAVPEYNDVGLRRQRDVTLHMLTYNTQMGLLHQVPRDTRMYAPSASRPVEEHVAEIVTMLRGS